jgi:erythronate-4-phosphate dehydrogenase
MRIVADENISHASEAFSGFGSVQLFPGREITNETLRNADVLIVRSVTYVNKELLDNTPVKFVGTATIGWDHIDTAFLKGKNIRFTSAAGCNSDAVSEYVFASIFQIALKYGISLRDKKIGVIGHGNIGSRVARIATSAGLEVVLNDPPLSRATNEKKYLPLEAVYDCDIVTIHVPLDIESKDKTYHLFNSKNLGYLKNNCIVINTSRGPVIDNVALARGIKEKNFYTILDVWEDEPKLNLDLLRLTDIATPHIAGYSVEGKVNGTKIIYDELCRFVGFDPGWNYLPGQNGHNMLEIPAKGSYEEKINAVIREVYDIKRDDREFRKVLDIAYHEVPVYFDFLRKNYSLRKEFFNYLIINKQSHPELLNILNALRFR